MKKFIIALFLPPIFTIAFAFSPEQVAGLQDLSGKLHTAYFNHCSHNVFVDRQEQFISYIHEF